MHVFLSDLHLSERDTGSSPSDARLAEFVGKVAASAQRRGERTRLIFLGDVFELLRSTRWDDLWLKHSSAPWSGAAPGFANFAGGFAEGCASGVLDAIVARHPLFAASLRSAVTEAGVSPVFVPGNHDFMVELSDGLRRTVSEFLALRGGDAEQFASSYLDTDASLYAVHGHGWDPLNRHSAADGTWAIGDAVVLRIVNRFQAEACGRLGLGVDTLLGRQVAALEDVHPVTDLPVYVRWVRENGLTNPRDRANYDAAWRDTVSDFLALKEFDGPDHQGGAFDRLRRGLRLSLQGNWADFLSDLAATLPSADDGDPRLQAKALRECVEGRYRFIVSGHTHAATLAPIGGTTERPAFYVNTGCWKRTVSRPSASIGGGPFVHRRTASWFVVDEGHGERYHLRQEWHAS